MHKTYSLRSRLCFVSLPAMDHPPKADNPVTPTGFRETKNKSFNMVLTKKYCFDYETVLIYFSSLLSISLFLANCIIVSLISP